MPQTMLAATSIHAMSPLARLTYHASFSVTAITSRTYPEHLGLGQDPCVDAEAVEQVAAEEAERGGATLAAAGAAGGSAAWIKLSEEAQESSVHNIRSGRF